jgi:hypothetical protein
METREVHRNLAARFETGEAALISGLFKNPSMDSALARLLAKFLAAAVGWQNPERRLPRA